MRTDLPDIIVESKTERVYSTEINNEEFASIPSETNTRNQNYGHQMPVYATVHKEKKQTQHSFEMTIGVDDSETLQPATAVSKDDDGSTAHMPIYATVSLKKKEANRDLDRLDTIGLKQRTSSRRHKNGDSLASHPPGQFEDTSTEDQSHADGNKDAKPPNEAADKEERSDGTHTIVYAELSTPAPNAEQTSSLLPVDARVDNPSTVRRSCFEFFSVLHYM